MIIKKIYDENTHTQKIWYDSSMIYYTEMVENELENIGDLYVVFKNGSKYVYYDVKYEDYLVFVGGGTDASQGKTLNKVIKGKYDFKRVDDADMNQLAEELNKEQEKVIDVSNTYFVSGPEDITEEEFEMNYIPHINYILYNNDNAKFIMGDSEGFDIMAQNYLIEMTGCKPDNIRVYHVGEAPKNVNPKISEFKGGFHNEDEQNAAMTNDSFEDIAYVRDINVISNVAKNILRRKQLKFF